LFIETKLIVIPIYLLAPPAAVAAFVTAFVAAFVAALVAAGAAVVGPKLALASLFDRSIWVLIVFAKYDTRRTS
jgi:hypothetical protein